MSDAESRVRKELADLLEAQEELVKLASKVDDTVQFGTVYQGWYSRVLKVIEALAPDRLAEFKSYYEIDRKRKHYSASTYAIQDYIMGIGASVNRLTDQPNWDVNNAVALRVVNQLQILASLASRIGSVLADVRGHLFAELQDAELRAASQVLLVNIRAAGAVAGVVLERHLQRVAVNHKVAVKKVNPTLADLNDPLKTAGVYDLPIWRKIQYLADIRNLCTHSKSAEPTAEQVGEMLREVGGIVRSVF